MECYGPGCDRRGLLCRSKDGLTGIGQMIYPSQPLESISGKRGPAGTRGTQPNRRVQSGLQQEWNTRSRRAHRRVRRKESVCRFPSDAGIF